MLETSLRLLSNKLEKEGLMPSLLGKANKFSVSKFYYLFYLCIRIVQHVFKFFKLLS